MPPLPIPWAAGGTKINCHITKNEPNIEPVKLTSSDKQDRTTKSADSKTTRDPMFTSRTRNKLPLMINNDRIETAHHQNKALHATTCTA